MMYSYISRVRTLIIFAFAACSTTDVAAGVVLMGDAQVTNTGNFKSLAIGSSDGAIGSAFVTAPGPDNFSHVGIGAGTNGGGQGFMTVSGPGAALVASNFVAVGTTGSGSLLIRNGGSVTSLGGQSEFCATGCNYSIIANGGGATGTVIVDGVGSSYRTQDSLNSNAGFIVGNGGVTGTFGRPNVPTNGSLQIINGATASTTFARLGVARMSTGTVHVAGASSNWTVNRTVGANALVQVGYGGTGTLAVTNGGTVNAGQMTVGLLAGATGNLSVAGAGSMVTLSGQDISGTFGPRLAVGFVGLGHAQVFDGAQIKINSTGQGGGVALGQGSGGTGYLDVHNGSQVLINGTDNTLAVFNGRLNIAADSTVDVVDGPGSTGITSVGGNSTTKNGTIDITDSTLNAGQLLLIANNTLGAGRVLLHGTSKVSATDIFVGANGLLGGQGTIIGNVTNNGGTLQIGASPDALTLHGDLTQIGGEIHFEVDPDGNGGFLTSTLVFDAGRSISIDGARIFLDFVAGADPRAFIDGGFLNLNTFFKTDAGGDFSAQYALDSVFGFNQFILAGYNISGFDPASGEFIVAEVPEPSSLLLAAFGILAMFRRKRGRNGGVYVQWRPM